MAIATLVSSKPRLRWRQEPFRVLAQRRKPNVGTQFIDVLGVPKRKRLGAACSVSELCPVPLPATFLEQDPVGQLSKIALARVTPGNHFFKKLEALALKGRIVIGMLGDQPGSV